MKKLKMAKSYLIGLLAAALVAASISSEVFAAELPEAYETAEEETYDAGGEEFTASDALYDDTGSGDTLSEDDAGAETISVNLIYDENVVVIIDDRGDVVSGNSVSVSAGNEFRFYPYARDGYKVSLVTRENGEELETVYGVFYTTGTVSESITVIIKSSEAVYESDLKLVKRENVFYSGQKEVELAKLVFSDTTTEKGLNSARLEMQDTSGNKKVYEYSFLEKKGSLTFELSSDGVLSIPDSSGIISGKGTLTVKALKPLTLPFSTASMAVTVKQGIENVEISPDHPVKLYKGDKAVSFKLTAAVNPDGPKPASNKISWHVFSAKDDKEITPSSMHALSGHISVKNGKVTISKEFVPLNDEAYNQFYVVAEAADYEGNEAYDETDVITVTSEKGQLDSLVATETPNTPLEGILSDTGKEYTSGKLEDYLIIAADSKGNPINREDYSLSYPDKSVYVTDDDDSEGWRVKFKKPGKITFTAKSLDGKTRKLTLKVKKGQVTGSMLNVSDARSFDYDDGFSEELDDGDKTTAVYPGTSELYLTAAPKADSITSEVPVIKVESGAVITGTYNKDRIRILPTAEQTVIKVSCGKKSSKYTITNSALGYKTAIDLKQDSSYFYIEQGGRINISANDLPGLSGNEVYTIKYLPPKNVKWSKYKAFYELLNDGGYAAKPETDGSYVIPLDIDAGTSALKPGEYDLQAVLVKGGIKDPYFTPVSAPVTLTIKAVKAPASPKVTIREKYVLKKNAGEVGLKIDKVTPAGTEVYLYMLCNNNRNGKINHFTSYFGLTEKNGKYFITLKEGAAADKIPAEDLTGWVMYEAISPSYEVTNDYAKVVISVK